MHESLRSFDNTFPTYHVVRIKDIWQRDLHYGRPDMADPERPGFRIPNPMFWKWCKWMLILHKPWHEDPWTDNLWGPNSLAMKTMPEEQQHQRYLEAWTEFAKTPRGHMVQLRIDKERADRLAARETLLDDDEYRERRWGNKMMACAGRHGCTRRLNEHAWQIGCLTATHAQTKRNGALLKTEHFSSTNKTEHTRPDA